MSSKNKGRVSKPSTKECPEPEQPAGAVNPQVSKFQRFTIERVHRSQLKEAPYNPRVMDEHGHKLLNRSLKRSGLVETIVWNRRTGYVVGGHQRLAELDKLEGSKDYYLDVAVIDVSEKEEREINIKLNNPNMMGEYRLDKLAELFIKDGVDFGATGFSNLDIKLNFDTPTANAILGEDREEEPEVVSDIEKINEIKDRRKTSKERANLKNTAEFFKVVVFDSMESMDEFCNALGFDVEPRHIDGEVLKSRLGIDGNEANASTAEVPGFASGTPQRGEKEVPGFDSGTPEG